MVEWVASPIAVRAERVRLQPLPNVAFVVDIELELGRIGDVRLVAAHWEDRRLNG